MIQTTTMTTRICLVLISIGVSMLVSDVAALSACNIKICQNKGCVKNFPSKYDGGLPQTIADLTLPTSTSAKSTSATTTIETTGCLSQCQNGPNIQINDRVFGRVDDIGMAAAILEVGADINMDGKEMGLLMAAVEGMANAVKCSHNNPNKAVGLLTKVIDSLVNADADIVDLKESTAMAHALILRADLRLEMFSTTLIMARSNQSVEEGDLDSDSDYIQFALEDALRAVEINDLDGRGWRVVADSKEAMGDVLGAMDAVSKWANCNPFFVVKAKKEIERLSHKSSP